MSCSNGLTAFRKKNPVSNDTESVPIHRHSVNYKVIVLVLAAAAVMLYGGIQRIYLSTDIMQLLPQHDPVLQDAVRMFEEGAVSDRIAINIQLDTPDPDLLAAIGNQVEALLMESGLFAASLRQELPSIMPGLIRHIMFNLPVLFSREELEYQVQPLLTRESIRQKLAGHLETLADLEGIGRADMIARDPLELRNIVLSRFADIAPSAKGRIYGGHFISNDDQHLLLAVKPLGSGTDSGYALRLESFFNELQSVLEQDSALSEAAVRITPAGAFRAALDNERIARKDTQMALIAATAGIALLLLISFPRPYIGLLSLLPAIFGTLTAFFVYSLFFKSISILTIGFGGAIISITVDHGIAYLLFLDQPQATTGKDAAKEVRAIGLAAALTSIVAFSMLSLSGFPILTEIGRFTALGILFSFVFVHTVFPKMFPQLPPASDRPLMLKKIAVFIAQRGNTGKIIAAGVLMLALAGWAWPPKFHIDLSSMNTVSAETREAENMMIQVWGDMLNRIYVMLKADSLTEFQQKSDYIMPVLNRATAEGLISGGFLPSMIFPGAELQQIQLEAWRDFWNSAGDIQQTFKAVSAELGFTSEAFADFFQLIEHAAVYDGDIPLSWLELISVLPSGTDEWWGVFSLAPGAKYNPKAVYQTFSPYSRVFDPRYFSQRLGDILSHSFKHILLIVGVSVTIFLLLFFMDITLALASLSPIVFALVCTLGALNFIGQPLDIPALMVAMVVFGMGVDYSIFMVRSYQRYGTALNANAIRIRMAIFLAAASTLIGFGAMGMADHALLKSAGRSSFLGIFFALTGAFCILPKIMELIFNADAKLRNNPCLPPVKKAINRFKHLEALPRLLARWHLARSPIIKELPQIITKPGVLLEFGCGYGFNLAFIMEFMPDSKIYGFEPNSEQASVARRAVSAEVFIINEPMDKIDQVPECDIIIISNSRITAGISDPAAIFRKLRNRLNPNGELLWRIPSNRSRNNTAHLTAQHILQTAGFKAIQFNNMDEAVWISARPAQEG